MRDILIVFAKEIREWLLVRESWRASLFQMAVFVGVFGVFWPLQINNKDSVAITLTTLSLFIGNSVVADSFAGERERNTLETLLATRLADHAIFLGKFLADTCYTLAVMFLVFVTSIVTMSLAQPQRGIAMYSPVGVTAAVGGTIVLTVFGIGLGVYVSLRTKTVRAAQQLLSIIYLVTFLVIGFVVPLLLRTLPSPMAAALARCISQADPLSLLIGLLSFLFVCDLVMLGFVISRFQRSRLILD